MAKKEPVPPTELSEEMAETKKQVLQMTSKRHIKIFLLSNLVGIKPKEIATAMGTNQGHVGNVLRDYSEHADKGATAKELWDKHINAEAK